MKRHFLSTRIWHWINLVCLVVLFMSGLNISNAHRYLYWGEWGFSPEQAWLAVPRFPGWATIPDYYSLAAARDWHILMAWPFALGLLFMWAAMLVNRHFWRDLRTSPAEWHPRSVGADIRKHLRLDFRHGPGKYNFLQKVSYGLVFAVLLPGMIFTGLAISPGFEAAAPWLVDAFGGRQSARSVHFIFAWGIFAFFVVHVALVLLSGPVRQMRDMITGGKA
ncbi:cytochrome b/b6 domain-containing protein [Allopontixanthobacter sediminis]|uniref:Cytochrome b561 bacterial/Ni-hydrogenase domain-containing protein n=1 Tax=Allopontixanthobacter sediminis TaxID=1689985 RepID=A0A845AZM6_9SPHN|nr:cytochrome b/b6 domain-containing protein [Allopontixanthobacter sediminis]MXP43334.1 hypothetical protein [Allopontixanthobacter sediminis]